MAGTVLLTLGRLPHAIDLARGFSAAGWRVVIAEPFRRHVTGASNAVSRSVQVRAPARDPRGYLDDLRRVIDHEKVDLVVPISEETMHVAGLHGQVPVFTGPQAKIVGLHDKQAFIAQAASYGLNVPETFSLEQAGAAQLAARGAYVLKQVFSCSGRGLRICAAGTALPPRDAAARSVVQAFLPGQLLSSCSIVQGGRVVASVIYRAIVFSGSVAVCFERLHHHAGAEAWIDSFAGNSGHTGFLSFDFIAGPDGTTRAIECNPRLTSGIHFMEAADVVEAVCNPEMVAVRLRAPMRLQQFYPSLTATFGALFSPRLRHHIASLVRTPDVVWHKADPLPFLTMMYTSAPIMARALAARAPLSEVAMLDLAWRE